MKSPLEIAEELEEAAKLLYDNGDRKTALRSNLLAAALRLAEVCPECGSDDVMSYCNVCTGDAGWANFASEETPIQHEPECPWSRYQRVKNEHEASG